MYCTVLYCTVLYCTVLHFKVGERTVPHSDAVYRLREAMLAATEGDNSPALEEVTVQYSTVQYSTVQYSIAQQA